MKSDDSIISSKQNHVAKLSAQLSKPINSLNKENNSNQYYVAAVERSAKFPIDELQRRVLKKLRPRYSVDAYKDLLANLDHISGFDRLEWLNMMDYKLRNERK